MKQKLLLTIIVGIFLLSFVSSALSIDTITNYDKTYLGYPEITLKDWFGLPLVSEEIFKGTIESHTTSCSNDCSSTIKVLVKEGLPYYDSIKFIRTDTNKEVQIYSYKIEKKVSLGTIKVPVYENVCIDTGKFNILNGTNEVICERKETGTKDVEQFSWEEITPETLSDGKEIELKISGEKKSSWNVDWVLTSQGEELSDWAVWTASFGLLTNLKSYWTLNETTGTTATNSINTSYNLNVAGTYWEPGKLANGYRPIAEGVQSNINFTGQSEVSISYWFNWSGVETDGAILGLGNGGSQGDMAIYKYGADNRMYAYIYDDGSVTETAGYVPTQHVLNHVVVTVNSSSLYFYVNGVKNSSIAVTNFLIGTSRGYGYCIFKGGGTSTCSGSELNNVLIDEFGIWNRTLTPTEVAQIYNSGNGLALSSYTGSSGGSVILNSPANNYQTISSSNSFNCSATPTSPATLVNISLWTNNTGWKLNQTIAVTGTTGSATFTQSLPVGNYNWSCSACDSDGDCGYASENRTFSIKSAIINSVTYNASAYETNYDMLMVNASVTTPPITTAYLWYNGTRYTATAGVDTATYSRIVPTGAGNKSFFWEINGINSSTYHQNILPINLTWCNYASPINITYINFTFKDESTNTAMNGSIDTSTWTYYIGDGTVTKTLIYTNQSVTNPNHPFCFSPSDKSLPNSRSIQYSFTGYPQRRYTVSDTLTNSTTQKTLYLLSSSDGIYVTSQVTGATGTMISDVGVEVYRDILGVSTLVEQGTTDAAGTVTFWLNPNYDHTFTFSKSGCTTTTTTLRPTQNQYTQTLSCEGTTYYSRAPLDGITYLKNPKSGIITPGVTTFYYQIYSKNYTITQVKFDLLNLSNGILNTTTQSCGPRNCTVSLTYNVTNGMNIKGRYYVNIGSGLVLLEADAYWRAILTNVSSSGTIKAFVTNFRDLFFEWNDNSYACGNYATEPTCIADAGCKWFIENQGTDQERTHCIPIDESNKLEFSRIVMIFFLICIAIAFLSKFTGYSQNYPGFTTFFIVLLIVAGSITGGLHCANNQCVGLFHYSGLFNGTSYIVGFLNNYMLALLVGLYAIGEIFRMMGRDG